MVGKTPHEDDWSRNLVCSYPKSGRTWVRFLLANYLRLLTNEPQLITFQTVYRMVPNVETAIHGRGVINALELPTQLRIGMDHREYRFSTHHSKRIALLIRDPRDILVSHWHHAMNHYTGNDRVDLATFIRGRDTGIEAILTYLRTWPEHRRENILIVTYEQLLADTNSTLLRLLRHFEIPEHPSLRAEAVARSTFKEMQRLERKGGMLGIDYDYNNVNARRVRVGACGTFRHAMDLDSQYFVDAAIQREQIDLLNDLALSVHRDLP